MVESVVVIKSVHRAECRTIYKVCIIVKIPIVSTQNDLEFIFTKVV